MFSEIEKRYRKQSQDHRFLMQYWPKAVVVLVVAFVCIYALGINYWLVYGVASVVLVALVVIFVIKDLNEFSKKFPAASKSRGLRAKLQAYYAVEDAKRRKNLVKDLVTANIRTKDDVRITLEYFQSRLPQNTKAGILEWALTIVLSLSPIILVAYDDSIKTINLHRLLPILIATLFVGIVVATLFIIPKLPSVISSRSRSKVDRALVEDLAYIYVNFEEVVGEKGDGVV